MFYKAVYYREEGLVNSSDYFVWWFIFAGSGTLDIYVSGNFKIGFIFKGDETYLLGSVGFISTF